MEVDTVTVCQEGSKRSSNVNSRLHGSGGEEQQNKCSQKPVFGPPVPRKGGSDSLHGSLRRVLGCFDDVAPYITREKQRHLLLGVTPCPPTPRSPCADLIDGPHFFIGSPDQVVSVQKSPEHCPDNVRKKSEESKKKRTEKDKNRHRNSSSTSQQRERKESKSGSIISGEKHGSRDKKAKDKKSSEEFPWKIPNKKTEKPLPPLKIPISEGGSVSSKQTDSTCFAAPLKMMVKNMQSLVATPLSKVKEEPFSYPQEEVVEESLAEERIKEGSHEIVTGERQQRASNLGNCEGKSTKKQVHVLSQLSSDLRLSEESDNDDDHYDLNKRMLTGVAHPVDSPTADMLSYNQDPWNLDNFLGVSKVGKSGEESVCIKESEPQDSLVKKHQRTTISSKRRTSGGGRDSKEKERKSKNVKSSKSTAKYLNFATEQVQPGTAETKVRHLKPCSSDAEGEVPSPDSGFQEGGSPGKENVGSDDGAKTGNAASNPKNAQAILHESRLSPLLSPIPEFPPLVFGDDGRPSLMCRINISLLDPIPKKVAAAGDETPKDSVCSLQLNEPELPQTTAAAAGVKEQNGMDGSSVTTETHGVADDVDEVPLNLRKEEKKSKKRKSSQDEDDSPAKRVKAVEAKNLIPPPKLSPVGPVVEDKLDDNKKKSGKKEKSATRDKKGDKKTKECKQEEKKNNLEAEAEKKPNCPTFTEGSPDISSVEIAGKLPKINSQHDCSAGTALSDVDVAGLSLFPTVSKIEIEDELHPADFYLSKKAKPIKHDADALPSNNPLKILLYLKSIVYFLMTVRALEKEVNKESSRPFSMAKETYELLRQVTQRFVGQASSQKLDDSTKQLLGRVQVLSLRAQAIICFKLYSLRQSQALSNYRTLNEYHYRIKQSGTSASHATPSGSEAACLPSSSNTSSTPSPTPSPASSVGSGSANSLPPGHILVPQKMDQLYKQQLSYLHHLMWAHRHWDAADEQLGPEDKALFNHLDGICGPLTLESNVSDLCVYILTAVDLLEALHRSN